ncbi:uncharacterized protein LOC113367918 [Ctenocephalides felis]|uniref:uncharacterized protein LOC113367918 n=1 Tax=Ctenocephalides felis TaxID=7515 RepID=UPI000E6E4769|nr:uncharacterized protein LOC113367918 [Ctenocephalides felis]
MKHFCALFVIFVILQICSSLKVTSYCKNGGDSTSPSGPKNIDVPKDYFPINDGGRLCKNNQNSKCDNFCTKSCEVDGGYCSGKNCMCDGSKKAPRREDYSHLRN